MQYIQGLKKCISVSANLLKLVLKKAAGFFRCAFFCFISPFWCFIKKTLIKAPRIIAALSAVCALIVGVTTTALATNATVAYNVMLDGKKIATVKEQKVLAEAEILAAELVDNSKCNSLIVKPELVYTVTGGDSLDGAETLSKEIVKNSVKIVLASVLVIDSVNVAVGTSNEVINNALNNYLNVYAEKNEMDSVEYGSNLSVMSVYLPKEEVAALPCVDDFILNNEQQLPVQSYTNLTVTETVKYNTKSTPSDTLLAGSEKIVKSGETGKAEVTYKVAYRDGKEVSRTEISRVVTKQPVTEEVLVGTKRGVAADKNGDATMCWPVERVSGSYVSSYMGDDRGHKGMDIVAKGGTPIYAASSGKVVFASMDNSGYGNYIIIDHGNGLKTLYAHCSALYVNVGDTVSEGEHIAAVGCTGYSTGNHLHFEVRLNGAIVNPTAYIGYN